LTKIISTDNHDHILLIFTFFSKIIFIYSFTNERVNFSLKARINSHERFSNKWTFININIKNR